MACLEAPKIPVHQPPSPLKLPTFDPAVGFSIGANLCCQVYLASPTILEVYGALGGPPLPPGPVVNLAVINALLGYIDVLNQYIDEIPKLDCPLE